MALFIIQWQIQQLCQFLLPIFHFQYSFNAVDIAVARSLLSLPAYKIHFKTCVCMPRGRGGGRAMWAVASSCFLLQLPVAVASCHSSSRLPVRESEKTMSDCKLLDTLSTCRYSWPPLHMHASPLHHPLCLPATAHHVACVDISCAAAKHLQSFRLQIYLSLLLLEEFKYQYNPCRHFTCNTYTQRVQLSA